ncbi:YHYH protein [Pleurocapsales cyanobacterium LEGE 10410]|nr:YHYH protein [Pleurocapsales cyanobacterium LEGE 10410]
MKYSNKRKVNLSFLGLVAIAKLAVGIVLLVSACQRDTVAQDPMPTEDSNLETSIDVDPSLFVKEGLVKDITKEPCTLSGGTETTCYRITTVTARPSDHQAGPWCPSNITATPEEGGIWIEDGKVYDVDGNFIANLDEFYNDDEWKLYRDDGTVRVTRSKEECAAAARPDVDEEYNNYCVQCLPEYVDEDAGMQTFVIPVTPVTKTTLSETNRMSAVGVALNGVTFDPPAPTEAILSAHTLAPFDDCGGHINLHGGYHYHAHTGCPTEVEQPDNYAPMIGYALDGLPLYANLDTEGNEATNLDQCRGVYDEVRGYHYRVAEAGSNSFIDCFKGESGCKFEGDGDGQLCDATAIRDRPAPPPPGNGRTNTPPDLE